MRPPALLLSVFFFIFISARAAEPFFKKGDVIALVGGEDMVVASEDGCLELLLTRALPAHRLRFRNLAWEGDTVFEQRRDLGFPTWEEQLEKIGATVVICQFGQMESLGKGGRKKEEGRSEEALQAEVAEFIAAYEKLIERFSGGGKRRVVVMPPNSFTSADAQARRDLYVDALPAMKLPPGGRLLQPEGLRDISPGQRPGLPDKKTPRPGGAQDSAAPAGADAVGNREPRVSPGANIPQPSGLARPADTPLFRDGVHLTRAGQSVLAFDIALLAANPSLPVIMNGLDVAMFEKLIRAKNRLWFDYWRPQNWAFLAGDRTAQPSSRDHLDPSKRWFPPEREAFLPLIEAKEREIDALAAPLKAD